MVYRRSAMSPQVYAIVTNSTYTLEVNSQDLPMQGCSNITLNTSQHFQILENDIIAACVLDNEGEIFPLFVTSTGKLDAIQVYQSGYENCRDDQLNIIDLSSLDHRMRNALHVHATLDVEIPPRVGNNPSASPFLEPEKLAGTYLNTQFPAETDGLVTSWHYCYYPMAANESMQVYSATVAVWQYDNVTDQYIVLNDSMTALQLNPENGLLTTIYCKQQLLNPASVLHIRRGNVVGVVLSTNPIPMIGQNSEYSIMTTSASLLSPMQSSLTPRRLALHLYADITIQGTF